MNFLGWIDHDAEQEEAILRALGAAKGHDARDELGLGTIRDSFADLFFPGLSTIQQRVRYFLFVQWCCELAAAQGEADRILSRLRECEVALIKSLQHLGEGEGVIGILSQEDLERMPSEIYWNGLMVLGMRRARGSRRRWARQVATNRYSARIAPQGEEGARASLDLGFDPDRPAPPTGFPAAKGLDFTLTANEADFLRLRLKNACIDPTGRGHEYNLFGVFTRYPRKTNARNAWDHPRVPNLSPAARDLLMLGSAFARIMHGAVILYNACVARLMIEEGGATQTLDAHESALTKWADELGPADVDLVAKRTSELAELGRIARHRIDDKTISFVSRWTEHCREPRRILNDPRAARLVSDREVFLKSGAGTSRIRFSKARARWGGESGSPIDFRWHIARRCLNDLVAPADA